MDEVVTSLIKGHSQVIHKDENYLSFLKLL